MTGRYKGSVDLSEVRDVREFEEDMEVGRETRANEYRAGVVPKTANTMMGPHAWTMIRNGLDG